MLAGAGLNVAEAGDTCQGKTEGVCLYRHAGLGLPWNWYHNGYWDGTFHDDVYNGTGILLADSVSSISNYSNGVCGGGYLRADVNFMGDNNAFTKLSPPANVKPAMNDKASSIQWVVSIFTGQFCFA